MLHLHEHWVMSHGTLCKTVAFVCRWVPTDQAVCRSVTASTQTAAIEPVGSASVCQAGRVMCSNSCQIRQKETAQNKLNVVHPNFHVVLIHDYPFPGARCDQPCPEGFWGRQCNYSCSCLNGATCLRDSGTCKCRPGYHGSLCQHSKCGLPPYCKHISASVIFYCLQGI